jgi:hypothetical protein
MTCMRYMARTVRRSLASFAAIAAASIFSLGCQAWKDATAQQQDQARYELKQDSQGRVIRLDKMTGEVVIVDGTRLVPVKGTTPAPNSRQKVIQVPTRAPLVAGSSPEKLPESAAAGIEPITLRPPDSSTGGVSPVKSEPAPEAVTPGQQATIASETRVFVSASERQIPLTVLNRGTLVRVRAVEGDWYQIEFNDSRWGRRFGFVAKKNVVAAPEDFRSMKPVDLSIRDRKRDNR